MIIQGDCLDVLKTLPSGSVHTCVTSPPYFGLRKYGDGNEIGAEPTPAEFVAALVAVFQEVRRVLRDDGTVWLNLGDSYANPRHYKGNPGSGRNSHARVEAESGFRHSKAWPGARNKDLIGLPWRVAFALQADGWYLRQDIIWHKPNPIPESVRDRCTKAHEYVFLLSKSERYYYDADAIKEKAVSNHPAGNKKHKYADAYTAGYSEEHRTKAGLVALNGVEWETRNRRSVWTVATQPYSGAHFATFPPKLIEPCILAGAPKGGTVLDPFVGAGTTALVCHDLGRECIGIELYAKNVVLAEERLAAHIAKGKPNAGRKTVKAPMVGQMDIFA